MTTPEFRPTTLPGLRRSAGLKLILICALVLLMAIPAMFIGVISFERSSAAQQVTQDVSRRYGGEQVVIGPILSVPYETQLQDGSVQTGHYILYPDQGQATFNSVNVEIKSQSLYKVPVYTASGSLQSRFDNPLTKLKDTGLKLELSQARFLKFSKSPNDSGCLYSKCGWNAGNYQSSRTGAQTFGLAEFWEMALCAGIQLSNAGRDSLRFG